MALTTELSAMVAHACDTAKFSRCYTQWRNMVCWLSRFMSSFIPLRSLAMTLAPSDPRPTTLCISKVVLDRDRLHGVVHCCSLSVNHANALQELCLAIA